MKVRPGGNSIRQLPRDQRPRERLSIDGPASLSDIELLAVVIGSGNGRDSALDLASRLSERLGPARRLCSASLDEIAGQPGFGPARAARVVAALELGRRAVTSRPGPDTFISGPSDVAALLMNDMRTLEREEFRAIFLTTRNAVMAIKSISAGSLNSSVVHPRELFRDAVRTNAASVLIAHNHPSGDPTPSRQDIALTARMAEAGRLLGISLIDHVIIGDGVFRSLKEENLI